MHTTTGRLVLLGLNNINILGQNPGRWSKKLKDRNTMSGFNRLTNSILKHLNINGSNLKALLSIILT